ncbi:phosphopantetheine-binding protein [Ruminiclostridium papyrosolvens]|uniref:Phosphopantetheine-binding protein n=1 Tax=Ruminiclostridium papyrosolvens C7 TaxID=1330534 RepID=U4R4Z0_9FIRM|nr:phosphopantetheine-binding protein [Ruminiclostridium papyrosolvens]EPR13613.1 phosphopantetheine-binding protein [Ruminiclostridium papyrosolvens C7]
MDSVKTIRDFINENLITFNEDAAFTDEDDIFKLGFVNSLFAMKLLTFIENEFNIKVENEEMELSNFNSVSNIVNFIDRKTKNN